MVKMRSSCVISNSILILALVTLACSETRWIRLERPEVLQPILYSDGKFRHEPLANDVFSCGIGPGVVFFKKVGDECPSSTDIRLPYGSTNYHKENTEKCFDSKSTLISAKKMETCPTGSVQAAFDSLSRGCKKIGSPSLIYGTLTQSSRDCSDYVVLDKNSKVDLEGHVFCSVQAGICSYGSFSTGLAIEKVYYARNTDASGTLYGDAVQGLASKRIGSGMDEPSEYFPEETTIVVGTPIGIFSNNYLKSGLKHTEPQYHEREKRSASAFAGYVLSYSRQIRDAAASAFRTVDRNFDKSATSINNLNQYAFEQATVMKSMIESVPSSMKISREIEVKNNYIVEVVDQLSKQVENIEDFTLMTIQTLQEQDFQTEEDLEEIKANVEQSYPGWTVKQITSDSNEFLIRIQKGSFLNEESPELQCSSDVCYLEKTWYHATGSEVNVVKNVYINYLTCGLFFRDSSVKKILEAQNDLESSVRYLKQYSVEFVSPTGMRCAAEVDFPQSDLFSELSDRMNAVNEGSVVLSPTGDYKLECSENGTLKENFPVYCDNYFNHNTMYTVLDAIKPERVVFEKIAADFEKNTDGFKALSNIASNLGKAGGQIIGALAELPKGFVEGLEDWTEGITTKMTVLFVIEGINVAALVMLYFLYMRNKSKASKREPQEE